MLEAVGLEKGTLESSIGEDPVDDLEIGRSVALVVPFCVCLSQYLCQYGDVVENRGQQTSTGAAFDGVSPLGFDFFFCVLMPRARCDSLIVRQMQMTFELGIKWATLLDQQGGNSDIRIFVSRMQNI